VVSGGKQFRVAPGDRILVDRVAAEPGSDLTLDRVLLWRDGDQVKVTGEELQGVTVSARVVDHRRGAKIDVLRYKPKKRVRVHRGSRADLTELEIVSVGTGGTAGKTGSSRGRRRTKEPASDSGESSPPEGAASSSQEGD
jgi:large subunit ribosomal protein L21